MPKATSAERTYFNDRFQKDEKPEYFTVTIDGRPWTVATDIYWEVSECFVWTRAEEGSALIGNPKSEGLAEQAATLVFGNLNKTDEEPKL